MKNGLAILALALLPSLIVPSARATPVAEKQQASSQEAKNGEKKKAAILEWADLMPEPDPQVVDDYRSGQIDLEKALAYLDKLSNTSVDDLDSTYGRIPGYLIPLNMDKNQKATELLLVPTLGACVHVPPPPPNQTIYIKLDEGIKVSEAGYTPYWITGNLIVEKNTSEYTDTLYSIDVESIEEFSF